MDEGIGEEEGTGEEEGGAEVSVHEEYDVFVMLGFDFMK